MRTILFTGSRSWSDVDTCIEVIETTRRPFRGIVGDARGFDKIIWELLTKHGLPRWKFYAKWNLYGNAAGHVRNELMLNWLVTIDPSGYVVAGWDGQSSGTAGMIELARDVGVDVWRLGGLHVDKD